ncbi:MAG: hypothetical protein GY862_21760 [Gammaproteobacteria bacterium]|nr:hypothetical protein [Gammaproteobacteria bacterium]
MRLYRDQWRVPDVVPKMPPVDEVRGECRARIGASVRFARGANAPCPAFPGSGAPRGTRHSAARER